ncbi:MAG: [ribosomal protein S5]-alanine N-acetyltransferase [Clostridiales bacterium]|nr:[ribosomal protein S5]-alanine N-acetyltransferase [Clostridiales bacterium]
MIILETERLILRTWELTDVDAGYAIWGDREVMKFLPSVKVMTRDEVVTSIKKGIDHQIKYGYQHWAVILKENDQLIGACGFNRFDDANESSAVSETIEMSFHFQRPYWGNGFASEAAAACVAYAEENFSAKRIVAGVDEQNVRSVRILEKLYFTYLGLVYFEDSHTFEPMFERWLKIDA